MHTKTLAISLLLGGAVWAAPNQAVPHFVPDNSLRTAFLQAAHRAEPIDRTKGGGFRVENPENRLTANFQDGAVKVDLEESAVGLRLAAYGRGRRLQAPAPASVHAEGTRVEYRRGGLIEWYDNQARGLEQGFTFQAAPATAASRWPSNWPSTAVWSP